MLIKSLSGTRLEMNPGNQWLLTLTVRLQINPENWVNTQAVVAMAPCVDRAWAAMNVINTIFFGELQRIRISGKIAKDDGCSLQVVLVRHKSLLVAEITSVRGGAKNVLKCSNCRDTTANQNDIRTCAMSCFGLVLVRCNSLNFALCHCCNRRFPLWFCLQFCGEKCSFTPVGIYWNSHGNTINFHWISSTFYIHNYVSDGTLPLLAWMNNSTWESIFISLSTTPVISLNLSW